MNNRKQLRQTRGWYPNDPALFISSKATHSRKLENWIANPFSALGVLTVICSLISAVLGGTLVSVYLEPTSPGVTILYSGLFIGIFSLAAFALGLYSGILLLSRRHLARATTSIAVVLVLGVATLLAPILEKIDAPLGGLSFALPMIISSVATLCVVGLNMFSQRPRLVNQQPPTLRQRGIRWIRRSRRRTHRNRDILLFCASIPQAYGSYNHTDDWHSSAWSRVHNQKTTKKGVVNT